MRSVIPRRRRGLRIAAWSVATILVVAAGLFGLTVWQNSYDVDQQRVSIASGGRTLNGVLAIPKDNRHKHGLVVYIHGDGPINATYDDGYLPMWEAYAKAGYATLSWDKPGINGAPGNWLTQTMDDRANEAAAAIAWARTRPDIDGSRIGLWGSSQAGWVLPKIAAKTAAVNNPVRFVIAVSPAINWRQQGRYNLLAQLRADGASPTSVKAEIAKSDTTQRLLERGATFPEYVRVMGANADIESADRWAFIKKNYTSDATRDLQALRGVPVLLALAGNDINVDVADTERGYRKALAPGGALEIKRYPDATHSMVKQTIEKSEISATFTSLFAPRLLFAGGYLDDLRQFAMSHA